MFTVYWIDDRTDKWCSETFANYAHSLRAMVELQQIGARGIHVTQREISHEELELELTRQLDEN